MEQFKRAQVIMLPTKVKETSIIMLGVVPNHSILTKTVLNDIHDWMKFGKPQHLYIISDDEMTDGDYHITSDHEGYGDKKYKIIATTDTSLKIFAGKGDVCDLYYKLPQPSQQFIEKYIESYNKGEVITDVLVEYEKYGLNDFYDEDCNDENYPCHDYQLKINPKDNTITIKKIKDNWSREEVIKILKSFEKDIENSMDSDDDGNTFNNINSDKWIEENL